MLTKVNPHYVGVNSLVKQHYLLAIFLTRHLEMGHVSTRCKGLGDVICLHT